MQNKYIWYCSDCGDGPLPYGINSCDCCAHLRCSHCLFEGMSNVYFFHLFRLIVSYPRTGNFPSTSRYANANYSEEHSGTHKRRIELSEIQETIQKRDPSRDSLTISPSDKQGQKTYLEDQDSPRQSVISQPNKLRKLNTSKCDRCRADKQKVGATHIPVYPQVYLSYPYGERHSMRAAKSLQCLPTPRVWPLKCDRCNAKGFPCSENKKTERRSKHEATGTSSNGALLNDSSRPYNDTELLQQWYVTPVIATP
jgi:hypothetical protein